MAKTHEKNRTAGKPTPTVLSINICDAVIRDESTKKISLIGIFNTIHVANFPSVHPLMHLYMALTNGHGQYQGEIRLVDDKGKILIHAEGPLEFKNPLQVVEINFEWRQLKFEHEGEYVIEVMCDSHQVGIRKFRIVGPKLIHTSGTEAR